MSTPLSLEASKAIYDLVGDYPTEKSLPICDEPGCNRPNCEHGEYFIPRPTFSELIRILPKIGEKIAKGKLFCYDCGEEVGPPDMIGSFIQIGTGKCTCSRQFENNFTWDWIHAQSLTTIYMSAPTEPEGMRQVGEYLIKLLK